MSTAHYLTLVETETRHTLAQVIVCADKRAGITAQAISDLRRTQTTGLGDLQQGDGIAQVLALLEVSRKQFCQQRLDTLRLAQSHRALQ
ncbi:hypothetical protein D3C76_1739040 [compost metagenome]